ncbi:hypothetical protein [Streptomyces erythrochromogenes]|uniref:hypothetical protein n=1 Tax=Streptomyces erythrochromogenes TaxID=285574 RepID=UPI003863027A|nr:hypothetical protein OG489_17875 [Streptomyces erythrochromogenes]
MENDHTGRRRAWVGDLVRDESGREAIVTDVTAGTVWTLRTSDAFLSDQWITTDPGSLLVLKTRAQRMAAHETH